VAVRAAHLAAGALELLEPVEGPVVLACPRNLHAALAGRITPTLDGRGANAAVVGFLGKSADPTGRQTLLASLRAQLPIGARVVVVDHNQPRGLARRILGALALMARGLRPARARYPAARELAALGFQVERLRLASGERIQIIAARTERA
jgi:hypothetical protein